MISPEYQFPFADPRMEKVEVLTEGTIHKAA